MTKHTLLPLRDIQTIPSLLDEAARVRPDHTALIADDYAYTFAELQTSSNRLAHVLLALDIEKGAHVGCIGFNSGQLVSLMFATMKVGAIWTPLNWRLPAPTLHSLIEESSITLLFYADETAVLARELDATSPIQLLHCNDVHLSSAAPSPPTTTPVNTKATAIQVYTSGTSGLPKGVMLSHCALIESRKSERAVPASWAQVQADDVNLVCMPNFHVSGALSIISGIANLSTTILLPQFEVNRLLKAIDHYKPARLLLVPSAIKLLIDDPASEQVDFSNIQYVFYGGSPMPEPLMNTILSRMNCEFVQFYGMTETAGRATYLPPERHKSGTSQKLSSCGQPFPGVSIEIRDDHNQPLPQQSVGEVCIQSRSIMSAYCERPDETAQALDDGWYHTGDIGYLDADGDLFIIDRLNDKIVTGGENVYPSEVEAALCEDDRVAEAVVFAIPDDTWIEVVCAAVVPAHPTAFDERALIDHMKATLGAYRSPKHIIVVDSIPRSAIGKVLRKEMAAYYLRNATI